MPLSKTSTKVLSAMQDTYGSKKGEQVFYATAAKKTGKGGKAEKAGTWTKGTALRSSKETSEAEFQLSNLPGRPVLPSQKAKDLEATIQAFIAGTTPILLEDTRKSRKNIKKTVKEDKEVKEDKDEKKRKSIREMVEAAFEEAGQGQRFASAGAADLDAAAKGNRILATYQQGGQQPFWKWDKALQNQPWWRKGGVRQWVLKNAFKGRSDAKPDVPTADFRTMKNYLRQASPPPPQPAQQPAQPAQPAAQPAAPATPQQPQQPRQSINVPGKGTQAVPYGENPEAYRKRMGFAGRQPAVQPQMRQPVQPQVRESHGPIDEDTFGNY